MSSNLTSIVDSLWPTDSCNELSARPILPDIDNHGVCGLQTSNESLMNACCSTAIVKQYQCWMFCDYSQDVRDFGRCIAGQTRGPLNSTTGGSTTVFCEGKVNSSVTETLNNGTDTSFGARSYSIPKLSWIVLAVLFSVFFVGPTSATIIPSLDNGLTRRQSDDTTDCTFNVEKNFARLGDAVTVSPTTQCTAGVPVCWMEPDIDTGMNGINRTINGKSAADPEYDLFFEVVSNATEGRRFPAQSRLRMNYGFGVQGGSGYFLQFVPYYWCVNGTATTCSGVFGDSDDPQQVTACGPLFVSDASNNLESLNGDNVQGTMNVVKVS